MTSEEAVSRSKGDPGGPTAGRFPHGPTIRRFSLRSSDVDEVRTFGSRHFFRRKFLHPLHRSGILAARFDVLVLSPLVICDAQYGADVTLGYDSPDAYQIGVPLSGYLHAHQAGRHLVSAGNMAAVTRLDEDVIVDCWSADSRQLVVKIEQGALEQRLQDRLDAPIRRSIQLSGQLDVAGGPGRGWVALLRLAAAELTTGTGILDHPLIIGHLREALTIGVLLATDHPYRDALHRSTRPYRPAPVRRTIEAIRADPARAFTVTDLALIAGVSVRTLQAGFRHYVGCTPMAYLRHVRLDRAHEDLIAADPRQRTVASIAYGWGFAHLGRFAAAYRARYHTTPARSLRGS